MIVYWLNHCKYHLIYSDSIAVESNFLSTDGETDKSTTVHPLCFSSSNFPSAFFDEEDKSISLRVSPWRVEGFSTEFDFRRLPIVKSAAAEITSIEVDFSGLFVATTMPDSPVL